MMNNSNQFAPATMAHPLPPEQASNQDEAGQPLEVAPHRVRELLGRVEMAQVMARLNGLDPVTLSMFERERVDLSAISIQGVALGTIHARIEDGLFWPDADGDTAVVIIPEESSDTFDLIAFYRDRPGIFGALHGRVFALGGEQITNPATYYGGGLLWLHATPLKWLAFRCTGIVILDDRPTAVRKHLRSVPRVACSDIDYGRWLRQHLAGLHVRQRIYVPSVEARA